MPYFQKHIFVCTNSRPEGHPKGSCEARGGLEVLAVLKSRMNARGLGATMRANKSGCLDSCEHGITIVVYPEGVWYQHVTVEDVDDIIEQHLIGGKPVERLLLPRPTPAPGLDV